MKIVIPSYNRATILKEKTLKYVLSEGYSPSDIYVFLKNDEQLQLYKQTIDTHLNWVVCNTNNLSEKRTFIRNYFPEDEELLAIDDDVKRLKQLNPIPLKQFVTRMFELTRQEKVTLWGVYPVNQTNMFYCKDRVVVGSVYCVGCFYGFINKHQEAWPPVCDKEDKWLSCLRITLDGAVLRYEGACADTSYYAKGGLSEYRTLETEERISTLICDRFPELVSYKVKKNGHPDVVFRRKKNKVLPFTCQTPQQVSD